TPQRDGTRLPAERMVCDDIAISHVDYHEFTTSFSMACQGVGSPPMRTVSTGRGRAGRGHRQAPYAVVTVRVNQHLPTLVARRDRIHQRTFMSIFYADLHENGLIW